MTTVAYFIGGPLDLTKSVVKHPETFLYALGASAFTLDQIDTAQAYENARVLINNRHVYARRGPVRIQGLADEALIYVYTGLVRSHDA